MTGIHDSVETYEPKVNMGYESSIPKVDNSFDDITDENGNINIIINSEVIGQTLAKKIYSSWASGLRELYNNEARACRTAKKMGANPSIVITIDPNNTSRQVIIQGVDSLGITKAMFNKVLRVIGTSGNTDGEEIGQYGMGFISYALMTDALLLETWSRETDEHYAMLCDSGLKFKPIPIETSNDVNTMSDFGTKLTMTCNDDVNWSTMVTNIHQLARFSQIKTSIIILDNIEGDNSYYGRRNGGSESYDKGVYECNSYKNGMEYLKDRSSYNWIKVTSKESTNKILLYDEITIDTEDYRLDAIFVIVKMPSGTIKIMDNVDERSLFLVGTAIEGNINVDGMHLATINIKNERKFCPVASRDSLETKSMEALQYTIMEDLTYYMEKYNINTIDDYNNSINKCVLASDPMYEIKKYLSKATNDISRTLNTQYTTPNKIHHTLNDMLAVGGKIVALKTLRSTLIETLTEHFDGTVQFFRIPTRLSDEEKGHRIALFKSLGVVLGEDYKKVNKIKEKRTVVVNTGGKKISFTGDRSCVLYNSTRGRDRTGSEIWGTKNGYRSGSEKYSTTINDVNSNVHDLMMVVDTKRFNSVLGEINSLKNDWIIMHEMKGMSEKITTLDNVLVKVANTSYQTNKGIIQGNKLSGSYSVIVMKDTALLDNIVYKPELENHYNSGSDVVIAVNNVNEYIKLKLYTKFVNTDIVLYDDLHGSTFELIVEGGIDWKEQQYRNYNANNIARVYWIQQLLPKEYAGIFTKAMQYDSSSTSLDSIERVARTLNEELKQ